MSSANPVSFQRPRHVSVSAAYANSDRPRQTLPLLCLTEPANANPASIATPLILERTKVSIQEPTALHIPYSRFFGIFFIPLPSGAEGAAPQKLPPHSQETLLPSTPEPEAQRGSSSQSAVVVAYSFTLFRLRLASLQAALELALNPRSFAGVPRSHDSRTPRHRCPQACMRSSQ